MKNLEKIRQESKEIKDKIDDTEERLIIPWWQSHRFR